MTDQTDRPINDMRELYAVQHAITDAGGTLTPAVHQAIDALRETWDRGLRRAQAAFTDRAAEAEPPLSPDYQHPDCGFHWHGRDGMDIPMRDGQPVCPRCELRRLADETPQPEAEAHPPEHSWAAELHDPLAEEWVPGTRYLVRERAVNALTHARTVGPAWRDGAPTQRRLVRATTTYTVEPAAEQPAAGQQPKEAGL